MRKTIRDFVTAVIALPSLLHANTVAMTNLIEAVERTHDTHHRSLNKLRVIADHTQAAADMQRAVLSQSHPHLVR